MKTLKIDEHLDLSSRRFSNLKFKRNPSAAKPFKSSFDFDKKMMDRSEFKSFNCGMDGAFSSECRKPETEKKQFEAVDYKMKYFELLKLKEKAFITKEDWAFEDDSSFEISKKDFGQSQDLNK